MTILRYCAFNSTHPKPGYYKRSSREHSTSRHHHHPLSSPPIFPISAQSTAAQSRNTSDITLVRLRHHPTPTNRSLNTSPPRPIIDRTHILKRRYRTRPILPQHIIRPVGIHILKHDVSNIDPRGGANIEIRGAGIADRETVDGDVSVAVDRVIAVAVEHEGRRGFIDIIAGVDGIVRDDYVTDVVRLGLFDMAWFSSQHRILIFFFFFFFFPL